MEKNKKVTEETHMYRIKVKSALSFPLKSENAKQAKALTETSTSLLKFSFIILSFRATYQASVLRPKS